MSDLPNGWVFAEIEEVILDQLDGKRIHQGWSPQCEKEPCNTPDEWGVLKTTSIQAGEFLWQHHKKLPDHLEARTNIEVSVGDLLLTCAGPRFRCGVACLVRSTRSKLLISGKMYRFRAIPGASDEKYLEAFLQTQEAQFQIDAMKTGGSDSGLNLTHERFKKLRVHLAPYHEQTRIVAKLEELLSDLDAGVAELKAAQKKLAQYRQSLLKAAVEGALTAEWRAKHPPTESGEQLLVRILKERRSRWEAKQLVKFKEQGKAPPKDWQAKYPEPVQPDTTGLPTLPFGWFYTSLDAFIPSDKTGTKTGPFGSLLMKHEHQATGVPVIGIENIDRMKFHSGSKIHISVEKAEELAEYDLHGGDVVISRSGTVGEVCVVPSNLGRARFSTNIMRVRLNADVMRPEFFCMLFSGSPFVLKQISVLCSGSTRDFLNTEILKTLVFAVPPLAEQDAALTLVAQKMLDIDSLRSAFKVSTQQSTAQRQNILRAAFSGQLVPQDPNDEPASELLGRIRTERAARDVVKKLRGRSKAGQTQ